MIEAFVDQGHCQQNAVSDVLEQQYLRIAQRDYGLKIELLESHETTHYMAHYL